MHGYSQLSKSLKMTAIWGEGGHFLLLLILKIKSAKTMSIVQN